MSRIYMINTTRINEGELSNMQLLHDDELHIFDSENMRKSIKAELEEIGKNVPITFHECDARKTEFAILALYSIYQIQNTGKQINVINTTDQLRQTVEEINRGVYRSMEQSKNCAN